MTLEEKTSQINTEYLSGIPRLGIPQYPWHNEALHGLCNAGVTVFPISIALAATFDTELVHAIGSATGDEGRVFYRQGKMGLNYFSPNLDIVRDPRWGRGQETYGEDPYLAARMGVAYITGLQGDHPKYLKTIASPKHFAVHSGPENLRFHSDPVVTQRDVWETYMPPFRAAVVEGGSYSIMCGYNAYMGVPVSVNKYLITDLVRGEWGLEGFVMNDCGGLSMARWNFGFGGSGPGTAALALKAGLDLECGEYYYYYLQEAIEKGMVGEALLDTAVFRVFKARFQLGLFDAEEDVPFSSIPDSIVECDKHRMMAIEAAEKAMVLLKNDGDLLPLDKDIGSIYVVGPNAGAYWEMLGAYAGYPEKYWTPTLNAIKDKVSDNTKITHSKGCELYGMMTDVAPARMFKTPDGQSGLKAEYFDNPDLEGEPVFTRTDSLIDFHWERTSPITGANTGEPFSVRWTGTITLDTSGNYTFNVISNDGARLYINNKKIVDSWWEHGPAPFYELDTLKGGVEYPFKLEYFYSQSFSHVTFELGSNNTHQYLYDRIVEQAKGHDVIVFVGGISRAFEGEMVDRHSINFPDGQYRMLKELRKTGIPIVLVIYSGSNLAFGWAKDSIPAILQAWYGGQEAGVAIANILFGDYNPSGRLPVTFYKSDGQLPPFEDYAIEGRTYRFFRDEPLYPFGYGLSYTTFEYENLTLPTEKIDLRSTDTIPIVYTVRNSGDRAGGEVTQLYTSLLTSKLPQPIKQLKGFRRSFLEPGEAVTDTIRLVLDELFYYDVESESYAVEPGIYEIQIGASSADIRLRGEIELYDSEDTTDNSSPAKDAQYLIFPNPAADYITIPGYSGRVGIIDMFGQQVFTTEIARNEQINIAGLARGFYIVRIDNIILKLLVH